MNTVIGRDGDMSKVIKAFGFSLILSLASLLAVLVTPITISDPVTIQSLTYDNEIKELRAKGYLLFEEKQRLDELVEKRNESILEEAITSGDQQDVWTRKSTILSPFIGLLWLIAYRAFLTRSPLVDYMQMFFVLSVPLLLAAIGAMSVVEFLVISVVVFGMAVWRQVSAARSNH